MAEPSEWSQRRHAARRAAQGNQDVTTRWGGNPVLIQHGFTPVVTAFLWYAAHLEPGGLSPAEVLFVLHLMSYKRNADAPYPSYKAIAQRMGVSQVYVRKIVKSLVTRGFLLLTHRRGESNQFDLHPLFHKLAEHMASRREMAQQTAMALGGDEAEVDLS